MAQRRTRARARCLLSRTWRLRTHARRVLRHLPAACCSHTHAVPFRVFALAAGNVPGGDRVYRMRDIVAMPAHTLPVLLVCAGNRRKEENMLKQTIGCG